MIPKYTIKTPLDYLKHDVYLEGTDDNTYALATVIAACTKRLCDAIDQLTIAVQGIE